MCGSTENETTQCISTLSNIGQEFRNSIASDVHIARASALLNTSFSSIGKFYYVPDGSGYFEGMVGYEYGVKGYYCRWITGTGWRTYKSGGIGQGGAMKSGYGLKRH